MDPRRAARYVTHKSFWRGVVAGASSPKGRAGFAAGLRGAILPSLVGALFLLRWMQRARVAGGRSPLTPAEEFAFCEAGAFAAIAVVSTLRWVWRRTRGAPAA